MPGQGSGPTCHAAWHSVSTTQTRGSCMIESPLERHLDLLRMRGLSAGTIYQRRRHVTRAETILGKDLLVADEHDIDRWQQSLQRLSPATRVNSIAHITEYLKWAHREGLIPAVPTRRLI